MTISEAANTRTAKRHIHQIHTSGTSGTVARTTWWPKPLGMSCRQTSAQVSVCRLRESTDGFMMPITRHSMQQTQSTLECTAMMDSPIQQHLTPADFPAGREPCHAGAGLCRCGRGTSGVPVYHATSLARAAINKMFHWSPQPTCQERSRTGGPLQPIVLFTFQEVVEAYGLAHDVLQGHGPP